MPKASYGHPWASSRLLAPPCLRIAFPLESWSFFSFSGQPERLISLLQVGKTQTPAPSPPRWATAEVSACSFGLPVVSLLGCSESCSCRCNSLTSRGGRGIYTEVLGLPHGPLHPATPALLHCHFPGPFTLHPLAPRALRVVAFFLSSKHPCGVWTGECP